MNSRLKAAAPLSAAALLLIGASVRAGQDLPEGPGQELTMRLCSTSCHTIERVIAEHRSKAQWLQSMQQMKYEGMKATDEQVKEAVSYLVVHFGAPVKVNTANARQLDAGLDLEPGQADAIVKYRDENGPFADLAALLKVPGLDEQKLTAQKINLVF